MVFRPPLTAIALIVAVASGLPPTPVSAQQESQAFIDVHENESAFVALRFLQLSQKLSPSPNAGFLVGSAAFGIAQLAATELSSAKSCPIATIAQDNLALAETLLAMNRAAAPDVAKQSLGYAAQLHPDAAQQMKILCAGGPS
ncbi:MAG: hypothetical protein ABI664_03960 [bacterium]